LYGEEEKKEGREEGRKRRESECRKDGFIKTDLDGGWGLVKDANPITLTELGGPSSEGSREEEIGCGLIPLPALPEAESKHKQLPRRNSCRETQEWMWNAFVS